MIALPVPTIRGQMGFTNTAQDVFDGGFGAVDIGITQGTTTQANVTGITTSFQFDSTASESGIDSVTFTEISVIDNGPGVEPESDRFFSDTITTFSTSISSASGSESGSESGSTGFGLISYTTTTETEAWSPKSTTTQTRSSSVWTTQAETETTQTADFSFTTTSTSFTEIRASFVNATRTATRVTALTSVNNDDPEFTYAEESTVPANVYDTIIEAEGNEFFLYYTGGVELSAWDGVGVPATNIDRGTRLTLQATVESENIINNTATQSLAVAELTTSFPYHTVGASSSATEATRWTNKTVFPPATFLQTFTLLSQTTESTTTTRLRSSGTITHYGNTRAVLRRAFLGGLTTYTGVLNDGRTFSQRNFDLLHGQQLTFEDTEVTGVFWEGGNGNTTNEVNAAQRLRLVGSKIDRFDEGFLFVPEGGTCSVVKPVGAVLGSSTGSYFTVADEAAPSFTGSNFYAKISRDVEEDGLALWTLLNTENASFTISETKYIWTTTTASEGTTVATTSSAAIQVIGDAQTRIVATKNVLGGTPEESATFYQRVPAGVYLDNSENYVTMSGDATSFTDSQPTSFLRAVPFLTNFGQPLAIVDRNSILRNGEFAQTLVEQF
jgi:hypothetical protein